MNQPPVTYFVEYIRGGDPDTELIRAPTFTAADDDLARLRARERPLEAGVDFGTLYRFRTGESGSTTELGRVDVHGRTTEIRRDG